MNIILKLFLTFFKIGMFTLGGGYAMIPLIHREVVEKNHWIEETEFYELLALAQSSPGPVAVNAAVFVGYKVGSAKGSIIAALGTTLPSFLIILMIAMYLTGFRTNPYVEAFFKGLRPAVVALIAAPLYSISKSMQIGYGGLLIATAIALLVAVFGFSPAVLIAGVAITSLIVGIIRQRRQQN